MLLFTTLDFTSVTVISTTGCCFCFGSVSSVFLKLFLHSSSVAYWAPTNLGSSSFSVLSFHLFILFMGFSRQEYWSGLPFPSPVDHVFSELSTMTHLSCVALHGMAHSFIELDKAVVHVIRLGSFLWLGFSVCLMEKDKRLMEASWWERLTEEKLGLVLMGRAKLSKSLMQFSVDGWSCIPSLLCTWGQTMVKLMTTSFKMSHASTATLSTPDSAPTQPTHASTRDSYTLTGEPGSLSCGVTAPFSWVLVYTRCTWGRKVSDMTEDT